MPESARSRFFTAVAISVLLAWLAGCSSDPRPENRDMLGAVIPDLPPVMSGTENFADGKLTAEITLAISSASRPGEKGGRAGGGMRSGRRGHPGGGGGMGAGGPPPPGMEGSSEGPAENGGPRLTGSTLPAAQLKLHLRNNSTSEVVECAVVDFNSALGNFAVFPDRYQLAAGQSAISETMTSRLGVEGAEIPVTVALRVRDRLERKIITLRLLPASDKPTAPAAP